MELINISNTQENLSENFTMQEFFAPTLTKPGKEFNIPKCLIDSIQHLRTSWNIPIEITSVYRPADTFGYHMSGNAVDFITYNEPLGYIDKFKTMCINHKTSQLFKELRALGLNGFGIEGSCIHIDFRPDNNCNLSDEYGKFCIFTWSEKEGSKLIW